MQNKNIQEEIWKPVIGYEGYYEVSNLGNVKSLQRTCKGAWGKPRIVKEKILSISNDSKGYPRVVLCNGEDSKHKRIHVLVANAFILNPENKEFVNHINGIKTDNRVENLEWVTKSENEKHAYKTGLKKSGNIGHRSHWARFTQSQIKEIRDFYNPKIHTVNALAKIYKVKWDTMSNILKNKSYAE